MYIFRFNLKTQLLTRQVRLILGEPVNGISNLLRAVNTPAGQAAANIYLYGLLIKGEILILKKAAFLKGLRVQKANSKSQKLSSSLKKE